MGGFCYFAINIDTMKIYFISISLITITGCLSPYEKTMNTFEMNKKNCVDSLFKYNYCIITRELNNSKILERDDETDEVLISFRNKMRFFETKVKGINHSIDSLSKSNH